METGYDILFFWVARMIMMGLEDTGDIPFDTVYLHGLIRDERGEKMSKIRGNVLNPIDTLEQYGTDAMRFALSTGTSPGNDTKLTQVKLEAGRNFANKLWNATRFVARSLDTEQTGEEIQWERLPTEDRWILSRFSRTVSSVTGLMDDFQFGEAQRQIYDFLWSEFCDWYIELAKIRLRDSGALSPVPVLLQVLEGSLRLLHPYMPFITEELWQNIKRALPRGRFESESIMVTPYPEADAETMAPEAERVMKSVIEIVRAVRNVRAQYNVEAGKWVTVQVYADRLAEVITPYLPAIETLARARPVSLLGGRAGGSTAENAVVSVLTETEVVIPMESMVDVAAEKKRLEKEIEQNQAEVSRLEARLKDREFLAKAPAAVVDKERNKLYTLSDKLKRLKGKILEF